MEHVGSGSATDAREIPSEILEAVESWLIDPRTDQDNSRTPSRQHVTGPLDTDLSSFLSRNGLT